MANEVPLVLTGLSLAFITAFALAAVFLGGGFEGVTVVEAAGSDFLVFFGVASSIEELAALLFPPANYIVYIIKACFLLAEIIVFQYPIPFFADDDFPRDGKVLTKSGFFAIS